MVADYIHRLLSLEEYSFSFEEVLSSSGKDIIPVRSELSRLVRKGDVMNLRKGFYLIIPPRYSGVGKLPMSLYVNKLFDYLERDYYVGLYSAAKLHGASHQQVSRDYVMIAPPMMCPIRKSSIDLCFFTATHWPKSNISQRRSDAGNYFISSPALTYMDLINYHTKVGGLSRMLATLEELYEVIDDQDLGAVLGWYKNKSVLQRAGFLMEVLNGSSPKVEMIYSELQKQSFYSILLSPSVEQKPGSANNRWRIDVNVELENDL